MYSKANMKTNQLHFIHNDSGVFILTIYVPSGSIYENIGMFQNKKISGISHFIEHLLYKHTEKYTGKQVLENFTKLGGFYNASTDKDQTLFYVKTLINNYELAIDLLYEIVLRPRFKRTDVLMERKVVLEELSQTKDDYDDVLYTGSTHSILDKENIYRSPVIGYKKDLVKVSYDTLWKYYHKMFKDFLVVVNCDVKYTASVKEYITNKIFKHRKMHSISFYDEKLEQKSSKFVTRVIIDVQNTVQYNSCLTFVSYKYKDYKNNIILDFLKFCLTDAGLYSVLSYAIREKRGLVYSIKASNEKMRYLGLFKIFFGTSNKDLCEILRVIIDILNDITTDGLDSDMLLFYKTSYLNHLKFKFTNEEYRSTWHGDNMFYGVQLTEKEFIKCVEEITNKDIKMICKDVFNVSRMSIYSFGKYQDTHELQKKIRNIHLKTT
jgi:predicted Zn-dependent peptidase